MFHYLSEACSLTPAHTGAASGGLIGSFLTAERRASAMAEDIDRLARSQAVITAQSEGDSPREGACFVAFLPRRTSGDGFPVPAAHASSHALHTAGWAALTAESRQAARNLHLAGAPNAFNGSEASRCVSRLEYNAS
jgi:hypothetical protein